MTAPSNPIPPAPSSWRGKACRAPARRRHCPSACSWSMPSARSPSGSRAVRRSRLGRSRPRAQASAASEDSYRTPPGWHRIHPRIGAGAAAGTVFVSREPTGETWRGEARDDDLILTRILTLDGLEDGVNRGAGCDSLERYIYLHGTNHESLLGRPALAWLRAAVERRHVCQLFDHMREGDLVFIAAPEAPPIPDAEGQGPLSLCGARRRRHERARPIPGDDGRRRQRQRPGLRPRRARRLAPAARTPRHRSHAAGRQRLGADCAALVVSTAVEEQVPDVAAARAHDIPIIHRSELLAHFVGAHRSIAVTGTSGKSTVDAMIFAILSGAGRDPSVITGADLPELQAQGLPGNAFAGALRPARRRSRRERRLAGALCAFHRRHPQSSARP